MADDIDILSAEFSRQAAEAGNHGLLLRQKIWSQLIEYPDGQKVENRFIPGV